MKNLPRRLIYSIAGVILFLIVAGFVYFTININRGVGLLTVTGPSKTMTYQVGNHKYTGPQKNIKLAEGSYTVVFSDTYYKNKTVNISISARKVATHNVILEQDNTVNTTASSLKFEEVANRLGDQRAESYAQTFPVTASIPYSAEYFQIEDFEADGEIITLKVNILTEKGKTENQIKKLFSQYLESVGQSESDLEIQYFPISQVNYQSPE